MKLTLRSSAKLKFYVSSLDVQSLVRLSTYCYILTQSRTMHASLSWQAKQSQQLPHLLQHFNANSQLPILSYLHESCFSKVLQIAPEIQINTYISAFNTWSDSLYYNSILTRRTLVYTSSEMHSGHALTSDLSILLMQSANYSSCAELPINFHRTR